MRQLDNSLENLANSSYAVQDSAICPVVYSKKKAIDYVKRMVSERMYSGRSIIAVDGKPCVGKTSFCRDLGAKIGAKVVHGDRFYGADDKALIDIGKYVASLDNELVIFDETYSSSRYAFDPLMRIYVRVSSEELRMAALMKRNREGDGVLFDRNMNIDFNLEFQNPESKFDLILDNTRTIESFVLNN